MSPMVVSRVLFGLLILNEVIVVVTSKSGEVQSLNVPVITRISAILFVLPLFITLPWPEPLGWLIVAIQAAGLALELLAELQLARARSFAVSSGGATTIQTSGMYRFLENPIYLGILTQLAGWSLWLIAPLIAVALFGLVVRGMVAGERAFLGEKLGSSHRGVDSFLWN